MRNLKLVIARILVFVICVSSMITVANAAEGDAHNIFLEVNIKKNLLFAKFDVNVYIDNRFVQTVEYGDTAEMYLTVSEGCHDLTFTQKNVKSVSGTEQIDVTEDCTCAIELKNHEFYIEIDGMTINSGAPETDAYIDINALSVDEEIESRAAQIDALVENPEEETSMQSSDYNEAIIEKNDQTELISEEETTDIEVVIEQENFVLEDELDMVIPEAINKINLEGLVTIDETQKDLSSSETVYQVQEALNLHGYDCGAPDGSCGPGTQAAIRALEADYGLTVTGAISEPLLNALGLRFSGEAARRALIVAMMNRHAEDIFTDDGMNYDPNKYHAFSEVGQAGSFIELEKPGTYEQVSEQVWECNDISLFLKDYNAYIEVSAYVIYDGYNYLVFGLSGSAPSYPDVSAFQQETDFDEHFVVPSRLVVAGMNNELGQRTDISHTLITETEEPGVSVSSVGQTTPSYTQSHNSTNDKSAAKKVIDLIAKEMFPYGIKIHWWIGLHQDDEIEFGVYHFVVDATITNMYNAKMDETLDIIIDMNNQEFISFDVY